MLVVETIAKIRRAYFVQKKPIKLICREYRLSRKVVRKVIRSVGGSIAIAAITKHEGFQWIQRQNGFGAS